MARYGTSRELAELAAFLEKQRTQSNIPDSCASQSIHWSFIPKRAPQYRLALFAIIFVIIIICSYFCSYIKRSIEVSAKLTSLWPLWCEIPYSTHSTRTHQQSPFGEFFILATPPGC